MSSVETSVAMSGPTALAKSSSSRSPVLMLRLTNATPE